MQDPVISCFTPEISTDRIMEVYICKFDFGLPLLKLPNLENNAILHIFSNVLFSVFVSNAPRYQQCAGLLSSPRTSMVS